MEISKSRRGGARPNTGGRRPGSGRKSKAEELGMATLLDSRLSRDKWGKVIDNLYKLAVGPNPKAAVSAAGMLLGYKFGKPTEKHEHANPDGSPLLQPVAEAMVKVYGSANPNNK